MPIFIPVILIGSGIISGTAGVANLRKGTALLQQARREGQEAEHDLEASADETHAEIDATNGMVQQYGRRQEKALRDVVRRMVAFLERHEQQVKERSSELFKGVVVTEEALREFTGGRLTPDGVAKHALATGASAVATYTGIPLAVATFGSASTGTAISTLSGAAAHNATLAWLGGGALSAGGGGMALGATALNIFTVGPTLLIGGLVLAGKGQKALTEAREYVAKATIAMEEHERMRNRLALVQRRVGELSDLLAALSRRGSEALDILESEPFDAELHADRFRHALAMAVALRDVISAPVLDDDGEPTAESERILFTYKGMT